MHTDQRLAADRQPDGFNRVLLWSFQPGNPMETFNQATTPKPKLGNPEHKLGAPKPRLRAREPTLWD